MTWPEPLLHDLERLVEDLVVVEPGTDGHDLATKLDILERVVELLRLRGGRVRNERSVGALLGGGLAVQHNGSGGALRIVVGASGSRYGVDKPRTPDELHVPLLLYLLRDRNAGERIGDDLQHFILSIVNDLGPADVETTETGVMRIATTTRMAARALRHFGLIRDSDETRTKTWDLTLLGILCALDLGEWHPAPRLPKRGERTPIVRKRGGPERLAFSVEQSIESFVDERRVREELFSLLGDHPDRGALVDTVAPVIAARCRDFQEYWHGSHERDGAPDAEALQGHVRAFHHRIEAVIPPSRVATLAARAFSLKLEREGVRDRVE